MNLLEKHLKKTKRHLEAHYQVSERETGSQVMSHVSRKTERQSLTTQKNNKMTQETKKSEENSIFIGGKPFMNYVTGVVMQFGNGAMEVTVKARGKFISKGVDVAEVARRKFLSEQNISVKDVQIGSEEFENKEGKTINVSILEVVLKKE